MIIDKADKSIPTFIRMNFSEIGAIFYTPENNISINLKYNNGEWQTFTAMPTDPELHGRWLYETAKSGRLGKISECPREDILALNRFNHQQELNKLINEADAIIQPALGYALAGILSSIEKDRFKAWNEYRKALEDVDVTATDIEWPAKPE